jgi:triosephosphate isomerase
MGLKTPLIIVNFKTYESATGRNAEQLAKICEKVAKQTKINIAVAVQDADIYRVSHTVKIPVLSEHMDPIGYGAHTGQVLPEDIKANGAKGSLLNHSEDHFEIDDLEKSVKIAKKLNLITIICASSDDVSESVAAFNPDFIAVEPPELIGGDISVSTAKPHVIIQTVEKVNKIAKIPILCGAGIKTREDVEKAVSLGAKGILIASAITKSSNPGAALKDLALGFSK